MSIRYCVSAIIFLAQTSGSSSESLVQSVNVIGTDDRRTFEQFAKDAATTVASTRWRFAASGTITCLSMNGERRSTTGQLTGSASVITTVGHLFDDRDKGCKRRNFKHCEFLVNSKRHPLILETLRTGFCHQDAPAQDWAVVMLSVPVADVTPYQVPSNNELPSPGLPVLNVAKMTNFVVGGGLSFSISRCAIRDYSNRTSFFKTDCDSGGGASGSGLLVEKGPGLELVGILTNASAKQVADYNSRNGFTAAAPVDGEFREALRAAVYGEPTIDYNFGSSGD